MKLNLFCFFTLFLVISGSLFAGTNETVTLPEPRKTGGMPLFDALNNRQTIREYRSEELSLQHVSEILWAAFGINREDGRRTAPSARNWQQTDIYLIKKDGWYLYEPSEHVLLKKGSEDLREYAGLQDFVATAPLNLIFVSDHERMAGASRENREFHSATDVGFISQNVYLYCASEGLATVVRGLLDQDKLHEVLRLGPSQHVILGQTVGYPKR